METIKRYGNYIIIICVILEMLIWPSINNFFGCLMTVIAWIIFSKIGLNEQVIREHIFAWLVFLSMSLYRILPLIATMLEGHSIGYNFVVPLSTYFGEILLYFVSALAFYLAVKRKNPLLFLKNILFHCGFYDTANKTTLWIIGMLGLIVKIYTTVNYIEYGNVIGKTLIGFTFFQYAPILIFFPILMRDDKSNEIFVVNKFCVLYIILLIISSFTTNSREAMLEPIGTFVLLFMLSHMNGSKKNNFKLNHKYVLIGIFLTIFIIPILNDISLAMLYNRKSRTDTNRAELFVKTYETLRDKKQMEELRFLKEKMDINASLNKKTTSWSETYVQNFALNRYCNLKVSDNTLYHAQKVGFANKQMFDEFCNEILILFPTPILKFFSINLDKTVRYSSGDKLKALATNRHPRSSFLITSHLADGLVTFGYWYFPIEFFMFFIRFLFLDTFLLKNKDKVYYSVFGLITIFSFLGMFRNAGGCCDSLSYMVRGYWQDVFIFTLSFAFFKKISLKL